MKYFIYLFLVAALFVTGCQSKQNIKVEIKNNLQRGITDQIVAVDLSGLKNFAPEELAAFEGNDEIPSQLIDHDGDGTFDKFAFLVNLDSNETKSVTVKETINKKEFKQRAHAEISEKRDYNLVDGVYKGGHFVSVKQSKTPEGHIDHNYYYKCEGPCWESDKVGYRFYMDWRNSMDIFGKKVNDIVLPNVGHTKTEVGNDSYHDMSDWGMDIFKVGNSLGIGTFAAYVDGKVEKVSKTDSIICTIVNDGPLAATVNTKYYGWVFGDQKIDLDANLCIKAGSRLTKYNLNLTGNYNSYCTGLAKHDGTVYINSDKEGEDDWNYIALWGKQSLAGDNAGIALFYNNNSKIDLTEDDLSYIVNLVPRNNNIQYYFAACWEQELNGIKTKEEFIVYLNEVIEELNNPVGIKLEIN